VDGLPTPPDILTSSSISTMLTPTTALSAPPAMTNPNYAKGWGADSSGSVWHIGDLPGTAGILQRDADRYWFVLLANSRAPEGPSLQSMKTDLGNLLPTIKAQIVEWPTGDPL
jgi:hypothetical protein